MIFDAETLARGWLAVALASSKDDELPAFHRTLLIDAFPAGVRLAATDSYMLLWSWVPAIGHEGDPEPGHDEAPMASAIPMDIHGRGKGLLAHVLKLATGKDPVPIEITLTLGVTGSEGPEALPGMEATYIALAHPGSERVELQCYEGAFPMWQKFVADWKAQRTQGVALRPSLVGPLLNGLGKVMYGPVVWSFGGANRAARLAMPEATPSLDGLCMPVRWDWDRDAPRADDAEGEASAE